MVQLIYFEPFSAPKHQFGLAQDQISPGPPRDRSLRDAEEVTSSFNPNRKKSDFEQPGVPPEMAQLRFENHNKRLLETVKAVIRERKRLVQTVETKEQIHQSLNRPSTMQYSPSKARSNHVTPTKTSQKYLSSGKLSKSHAHNLGLDANFDKDVRSHH